MIDYHLHNNYTIDGNMTELETCERASQLKLQEIAFTNHSMLTEPEYTISHQDFIKHWENIQICQERYPGMTIRLGLEIDYYPDRESKVAEAIQQYEDLIGHPFDLIMGSIHHLNGIYFSSQAYAPDLYNNQEIVSIYRDYFALATRAVQSQLFDVMAHPDLAKKYTGELSPKVPFEKYQAAVEPYVEALLACDVGIEINTKGLKQKVREAYPSDELLEKYLSAARRLGKSPIITIGSDAHSAPDVGSHLADGEKILRKFGQTTVMGFAARKPFPIQL